MPPDMRRESSGREDRGHGHKERIGNYILGNEIGRGSFATVYKGYRSRTRETVAIKAVSRQKLTTKLLENLESEINILKSIKHRNITALEECFKNESHIYLVMEFCSGSDLSIYIKNRGQLPTLDYYPRGSFSGDKIYYPHPPTGGLDERVTRSFLGQLAYALEFLRKKDLIHRDIKPQNLLLQPASEAELANGHPHGIPVLKVADFGFARILPATAMAETLCGSPLYMAPEILRYEKYDAKVDLWSVGAVLFEMAVGKPPFRANNHVELLRKIEKGEDRIKFPDESSRLPDPNVIPPLPVPLDIKGLIRALLKRHSVQRMSFEAFFGSSQIWEGYMYESRSTVEGSLDLDVSSESSEAETNTGRLQEMVDSVDRERAQAPVPTHAPQPISTQPALNPQPAKVRSDLEEKRAEYTPRATPAPLPQPVVAPPPVVPAAPVDHSHLPPFARPPPVRRSEPKYYVQDDTPSEPEPPVVAPTPSESSTRPRPIQTPSQRPHRRFSSREPGSVEEAQPITPGSNQPPPLPRSRTIGEGSPLAATPPITMTTGKDESALEADDSMVAQEYVVIDKGTVQVNALADGQWNIVAGAMETTDAAEVDQASKKPHSTALTRRPSSRTSVVSRPVSSFRPAPTTTSPTATTAPQPTTNAVVPMSYSPPFGLSTTPPFAIPAVSRQQSSTALNQLRRQPSIPQNLNVFPPAQLYEPMARFGSSPSSLQTGTLARALTNTAIKLIGTSASAATNAIARATATAAARQRPTIIRSGEIHPAEEELLRKVEDVARKAFALFELADQRLGAWQHLATIAAAPAGTGLGISPRRKSSSSSVNSDVLLLRQQEAAAGEAVVLFCKALMFIVQGTTEIQRYWERKASEPEYETSQDLNDMVQWLRARFNECYEKADFDKSKCADELPFVDKLLHDTARDMSRNAARAELSGDYASAEAGYESAIWLLMALLDDVMYEGGHIREDDKATVDKLMASVKSRAEALKRKIDARETNPAAAISQVQ